MSICRHNKSYVPQKIISIWSRERSHTPTSRLDVSKKKKKVQTTRLRITTKSKLPLEKRTIYMPIGHSLHLYSTI